MTNYKYNLNSSNIIGLTDDMETWKKHFGRADMVIEAVFEDIDLKRKIVAQCEEVTPDHCIFATNTSAIPIADIAEGSKRPEQIIGMHYFSPVPQMPLLEVIPHSGTSDAAKAAALEVGTKQGKTCIEVKDVPGFYVNRCLGPFLVEVSTMLHDQQKPSDNHCLKSKCRLYITKYIFVTIIVIFIFRSRHWLGTVSNLRPWTKL